MSHEQSPTLQSPPPANYSSAIARAVEWLGDRYLLARPINTPMRSAKTLIPGSLPSGAPRA
jgi:hypothetical protein